MTLPLLVTGGTGTLGRLVVPLLQEAGQDVRVLSRRSRESGNGVQSDNGVQFVTGDLANGDGLEAAVKGVGTVVHLAGSAKGDGDKARNLVQAATRAGIDHLVYISVVGADRVPVVSRVDRTMFGYFAAKRAAEHIVADSGLPWTTVRATQFHELMLMTAKQMAKMPVITAPAGFRFQPVDGRAVATRLVELALAKPSGLAPDIAGPRIYEMKDLIRSYLRASSRRRPIVSVRLPGKAAGAFRDGANLAPEQAAGRTWEDFLAEQLR